MQIDLSVLVTIVLAVFGLIGALIALIYRAQVDSVARLQLGIDQTGARLDAETGARISNHDNSMVRLYGRMEALEHEVHRAEVETRAQVSDLNVTVAGFGSTYATRRELEQLREDSGSRRRI